MNGKRITGTGDGGGDIDIIEILINFRNLSEEGNFEHILYENAIVQKFCLTFRQFEKANKC